MSQIKFPKETSNTSNYLSLIDLEDAKELVWMGAERWLEEDIKNLSITHVEHKILVPLPGLNISISGVLDLQGKCNETGDLKQFSNSIYIADWKTSKSSLDSDWKTRLLDSWQWRIYSFALGAKVFSYRGLSRKGETREVIFEVPENNDQQVVEYLKGASLMMRPLLESNLEVYPRHMPFACKAYGRDCPHLLDCKDYTMPRKAVNDLKDDPFKGYLSISYSQLEKLFLCPERMRRDMIADKGEDSSEAGLGKCVHAGLENLYKQATKNIAGTLLNG